MFSALFGGGAWTQPDPGASSGAPAPQPTSDAEEVSALKKMLQMNVEESPAAVAPPAVEATTPQPQSDPIATELASALDGVAADASTPSTGAAKAASSAPSTGGKAKKVSVSSGGKARAATARPASRASPTRASPSSDSSPSKHTTSTTSSTSSASRRAQWNSKPLRNPPGMCRGLKPTTNEPWVAAAEADNALRMKFGSRTDLGEEEFVAFNGFVANAQEKRQLNARQQSWDARPVQHQPAALRGQKVRNEPWSKYHNDDIDELNAIEGVSINELYAVSADRDNRVKSTLVQPEWDGSSTFGRRARKAGAREAQQAKAFREARKSPLRT